MTGKIYEVVTIEDLFSIPVEKRDIFFEELKECMRIAEAINSAIPSVVKTNQFNWVDDGDRNVYARGL